MTLIFAAIILFIHPCHGWGSGQLDKTTLEVVEDLTKTRKGLGKAWLAEFADDFGPRPVGSESLENVIDYMVEQLNKDGFSKVHTEEVGGLPKWIRGDDEATITSPREHKMNILAIGGSPSGEFEADVVVLKTLEELNTTDVSGKIVVFNFEWHGYKNTVKFRGSAKKVAAVGGVAVLVKSMTTFSIASPHTGSGAYGSTIPAASITIEEALMLQRWQDRGIPIRIKLDFSSQFFGYTATSRNVVFDIPGSSLSKEVVIFSAHIDSWDVGQGAVDDGGGMAATHEMMIALLAKTKAHPAWIPKRTIRGIFWTAEEVGLRGSKAYFDRHFNKTNEKIVFAAESDAGAFKPLNGKSHLMYSGPSGKKWSLQKSVTALNQYGIPLNVVEGNYMTDLEFLAKEGVPCTTYMSDRTWDFYFHFHHSNGDYVNIFDDDDIQYVAAIWAAVATNVATEDVWSTTDASIGPTTLIIAIASLVWILQHEDM